MAHRFRSLISFLLLVCVLNTRGADAPAVPKEVSVRFTVFALGGARGLAYRPEAGAELRELKFFSAYRSPLYAYRGASRLCFFDPAGGPGAMPVAIYDIPEGATQVLLLFFANETSSVSGLKYEVRGADDRVERTPAGHFTTINVSGRDYVAQYGASRITIPAGLGRAHPGKGRVALSLAAHIEGLWMSAGRHEFSLSGRDRVTLIFYPPSSPTSVYPLIRRLADTPISAGEEPGDDA